MSLISVRQELVGDTETTRYHGSTTAAIPVSMPLKSFHGPSWWIDGVASDLETGAYLAVSVTSDRSTYCTMLVAKLL